MIRSNTKGFLFDFNGTLFNDGAFHKLAWQRFMREEFHIELSEADFLRQCVGPTNDTILRNLSPRCLSDEEVTAYGEKKEALYREIACEKSENLKLVAGVPELFDLLKSQNIPFAVATASPLSNVRFYLDALGLSKWFTMQTILYEDGNQKGKPDPEFYTNAAHRIALSPSECTIVEDSVTGIKGAINAGAGRIIVITNTKTADELSIFPQIDSFIENFIGFERFI